MTFLLLSSFQSAFSPLNGSLAFHYSSVLFWCNIVVVEIENGKENEVFFGEILFILTKLVLHLWPAQRFKFFSLKYRKRYIFPAKLFIVRCFWRVLERSSKWIVSNCTNTIDKFDGGVLKLCAYWVKDTSGRIL